MQFVYPAFLFGLLALAIPIILHLFHFRRFKKVYFTNVRFLKEVKEETSNRSKLRNLLVLAARLLTLLFLVFAFAQPFLPQDIEVKKGEKVVSLFVDNSFSMSAMSADVPLLQKAKQRAKEIIEAYSEEDRFQVLTNDFEGRHQRLVSRDEALGLVDEIKVSPSVKEMTKVLERQKQALSYSKTPNRFSYIISDFQKNVSDFQQYRDTTVEVSLIPLTAVQEKNISIDSCWFEIPVQTLNQTSPLVVKVTNQSNQAADNVRLSLAHDGQEKPVGTLSIPAKTSKTDTVNLSILHTGWHNAKLTLTDYPIQFDDAYYFSFNVANQIKVLVINENSVNRYLDAAFSTAKLFQLTNQFARNLDYAQFPTYNLIVINEVNSISSGLASELSQFVKNGGNLLVFPPANANISTYNALQSALQANNLTNFDGTPRNVSTINTQEFIFSDVYLNKSSNLKLPNTKANFRFNGTNMGEDLLTFRDGTTFIAKYKEEKGNYYLCTSPLDEKYNDLSKNGEIFIPMLYKMAISTGKGQKIAHTIGRDDYLEADHKISTSGEMIYKLKGNTDEFIPEQRVMGAKVVLGVGEQVKEAGFYKLYINPQDSLNIFAFNYDRKESNLEYFSTTELKNELQNAKLKVVDANAQANFTSLIGERSQGVTLWRWCIILGLLFLLAEQLLLRFWKT